MTLQVCSTHQTQFSQAIACADCSQAKINRLRVAAMKEHPRLLELEKRHNCPGKFTVDHPKLGVARMPLHTRLTLRYKYPEFSEYCGKLITYFPKILAVWDRATQLDINTVTTCSSKEAQWQCLYAHSWTERVCDVAHRILEGTPACTTCSPLPHKNIRPARKHGPIYENPWLLHYMDIKGTALLHADTKGFSLETLSEGTIFKVVWYCHENPNHSKWTKPPFEMLQLQLKGKNPCRTCREEEAEKTGSSLNLPYSFPLVRDTPEIWKFVDQTALNARGIKVDKLTLGSVIKVPLTCSTHGSWERRARALKNALEKGLALCPECRPRKRPRKRPAAASDDDARKKAKNI